MAGAEGGTPAPKLGRIVRKGNGVADLIRTYDGHVGSLGEALREAIG